MNIHELRIRIKTNTAHARALRKEAGSILSRARYLLRVEPPKSGVNQINDLYFQVRSFQRGAKSLNQRACLLAYTYLQNRKYKQAESKTRLFANKQGTEKLVHDIANLIDPRNIAHMEAAVRAWIERDLLPQEITTFIAEHKNIQEAENKLDKARKVLARRSTEVRIAQEMIQKNIDDTNQRLEIRTKTRRKAQEEVEKAQQKLEEAHKAFQIAIDTKDITL
jgi:hypothetical protein